MPCTFSEAVLCPAFFARPEPLALTGSADQVPDCSAGNDARDIRRIVLIVAAEVYTITSLVLLSHCPYASGGVRPVGLILRQHGPHDSGCFVCHGNSGKASRLSLQ